MANKPVDPKVAQRFAAFVGLVGGPRRLEA
jgi:hypothetical protein